MASKLNMEQIQKLVFDEVNNALRVVLGTVSTQIELSAADGDSVIAYSGIEPREPYDYISYVHPDTVTIVKTYRNGGPTGTIVGVVTEVYTDNSHNKLVSQQRS